MKRLIYLINYDNCFYGILNLYWASRCNMSILLTLCYDIMPYTNLIPHIETSKNIEKLVCYNVVLYVSNFRKDGYIYNANTGLLHMYECWNLYNKDKII